MTTTPKIAATIMEANQASAEVVFNDTVLRLEWGAGPSIEERDVLNPSGLTPTRGEAWLIDGTGAGDWAGQDNDIAINTDGTDAGWIFVTPWAGLRVWDKEAAASILFDGDDWVTASGAIFAARLGTDSSASINEVLIEWDVEDIKDGPGNTYSHSTSVDAEEITLERAGVYRVTASLAIGEASGTNAQSVETYLKIDGTKVDESENFIGYLKNSTNQRPETAVIDCVLTVTAGQVLTAAFDKTIGAGSPKAYADLTRIIVQKIG